MPFRGLGGLGVDDVGGCDGREFGVTKLEGCSEGIPGGRVPAVEGSARGSGNVWPNAAVTCGRIHQRERGEGLPS